MSTGVRNLSNLKKAARIILVGPPGCGKGTQSGRLLDHFKLTPISSGDLLRENVGLRLPFGPSLCGANDVWPC